MTDRRKPGQGSVERLPSGRYRARVVLGDGVRHELGTFEEEGEAEGVIAATLQLAAEKQVAPVGGVTLAGWILRWLDDAERSRAYSRIAGARSIDRTWLRRADFYGWPLRRLEARHVRRFAKWLARQELSDSYVSQVLVVLRVALEAAVEDGLLAENPAATVRAPRRPAATEEPWTYLRPEEQRSLLALSPEVLPVDWRHAIAFAVATGLRAGEQWNLRLVDVHHSDTDDPHIVVRYGKKQGATKGRRIRRVPLLPEAIGVLRSWLEELPAFCPPNESNLLFPGARGGRRKVSRVPGWWAWLRAAGIDRRVRWHDLRHTCASSLVSGWWGEPWRLEDVKAFLGHRDIRETQRYAHLCESSVKRAARATVPAVATLIPRDQKNLENSSSYDAIGVSDGSRAHRESAREVVPDGGHVVDVARRLLLAIRAGQECGQLADDFADAVLASDYYRLAAAVRAGGPHQLDRALELIALVLPASVEARGA